MAWWQRAAVYRMAYAAGLPVLVWMAVGHASLDARPQVPAAHRVATSVSTADGTSRVPVISPGEAVAAPRASGRAANPAATLAVAPTAPARPVADVTANVDQWEALDASYTPPPTQQALAAQSGISPAFPWGSPSGAMAANFTAGSALTGDLDGLDPLLRSALEQLAGRLGTTMDIVSGRRTRAEQETLHLRFLEGTGNLAAVPGTSRHESGQAVDAYVDGVALANVPGALAAAHSLGLGFPVPGEAWHVETMLTTQFG